MSGKNTIKTLLLLVIMAALFMVVGWVIGGTTGMLLALVAAAGTNVFAWWNSGKMVRRMQGAHVLERHQSPELFEMVEVLAARAEIPVPTLYLMESDQPNAFATGRNPENGAICITTGIVKALSADELAGVIAHEMAHIRNYDTLTMTFTATMAGAISMLSQYVFWFGGGRRDGPLSGLGLLVAAIAAPIAALVVRMFVSRTREYEADRVGAHISGKPLALASALEKIAALSKRHMLRRARRHPALAHMFIVNPLTGGNMDSWFSTHPAIENRIAQLQEIARQMGRIAPVPTPQSLPPVAGHAPRHRSSPWAMPRTRQQARGE
jgi:heat shock protein HtpX